MLKIVRKKDDNLILKKYKNLIKCNLPLKDKEIIIIGKYLKDHRNKLGIYIGMKVAKERDPESGENVEVERSNQQVFNDYLIKITAKVHIRKDLLFSFKNG